jgi:CPA2 family monovalent cation:H+ antiporter-2
MGIKKARMMVIAISDPVSTRRIVSIAKKDNPDIYIIVRTRYIVEVEELKKLGANEVIPEEYETSIEIFSRVLNHYNVPRNQIEDYIIAIRADNYSILRVPEIPKKSLKEKVDVLKDIETEIYLIKKGAAVIGHSIKELNLRKKTGATIIAIKRGKEIIQNPSPSTELKEGDILWLIGSRQEINNAMDYLL